ncbi:MAG: ATP-binding cassette domain-containing protein, partial [Chloroflexi bacterium]|nr:ATP-binding cassette domain-containing protein [Chloroflexota bacterium]
MDGATRGRDPDPPSSEQGWREHQSAHFAIHYLPDSFAQERAPQVATRLEELRAALVEALELPEPPTAPIAVYLTELPDDGPQAPSPAGAAAGRGAGDQLWAVYEPDAPGNDLEPELVRLMLQTTLGENAGASRPLIDGLVGHLALRRASAAADGAEGEGAEADGEEGDGLAEELNGVLADELRRGRAIHLADFLGATPPQPTPHYHQMAASFVTHLLEADGPAAFQTFVRQFDAAAPDAAARAAYQRPMIVMEQAWLDKVRRARSDVVDMTGFVKRSLKYLKPYWRQEILILLGMSVGLAFESILPLSQKFLIDEAIVPGNVGLVVLILSALLVLFVVQGFAALGKEHVSAQVGARIMNSLRRQMFTRLQHLSMGYHTRAEVGDVMSRVTTDLEVVEDALTRALPSLLSIALSIIIGVILMFTLEWQLAVLGLITLPVFIIGPKFIGPKAAEASYDRQEDAGAVATNVQQNLLGQAVVKVFGLEQSAIAQFNAVIERLFRSHTRLVFFASLFGLTAGLSASFVQVLTLGVGAYLVIRGDLTLGSLMAFLGVQGNVINPIHQLSSVFQDLQQATGGMQRVEELLGEQSQVRDAADAREAPRLAEEIRLENVLFSYTGEQVNLNGVSFAIPAGGWYAFVGPSGCGKSTILNLAMRLYEPTSGRVLLDGVDIREYTQGSLRRQMGTVLQENFLFNVNVRENIRYGKLDATEADIVAAAEAAEIHDMIMAMPDGYDTVVGERGGRLSGGQRQRVAIARALVRDPAILILDEATSALDPNTEAAINETLRRVGTSRTVLAVTHRLSSAQHADRIFVFDRGQLLEQGTHQELLEREGLYAQLWTQQHGAVPARPQLDGLGISRLHKVPVFRGLDESQVAQIASRIDTERYASGDTIFQEGDRGDKLYIIARGRVDVV